jgi:hypothetical protein
MPELWIGVDDAAGKEQIGGRQFAGCVSVMFLFERRASPFQRQLFVLTEEFHLFWIKENSYLWPVPGEF